MKRQLLIVGAGIVIMLGYIVAANSARAATEIAKPRVADRVETNNQAIAASDTITRQLVSEHGGPALTSPVPEKASTRSANYQIPWFSINSGGRPTSSTNYQTDLTIGQSAIGKTSSANYTVGQGYWYGAAGSSGGCACDCFADPAPIGSCDGNQDVLDVVQTVSVAFRGASSILDPNPNCPNETTDVNCSGSTDVLDVVKMVNVAFRGADTATEFCNPCQ